MRQTFRPNTPRGRLLQILPIIQTRSIHAEGAESVLREIGKRVESVSGLNENQSYRDLMGAVLVALVEADGLLDPGSEAEKRYMYDAAYRYACEVRARQVLYRLHKMS